MERIINCVAIEDGNPVEIKIYLEDVKYSKSYCNGELDDHITDMDTFIHYYGYYGFLDLNAYKENKRTEFSDIIRLK